ncbi:unnamed protein product [Larinioides sclopetarius]|uniref:Uncharacterized protein n=1 Tax=Larinioides sclopetarius TaxID=280406 RepID=A0AAV2BS31_9ARAC
MTALENASCLPFLGAPLLISILIKVRIESSFFRCEEKHKIYQLIYLHLTIILVNTIVKL